MTTREKCMIAEQVGEVLLGAAGGIILKNTVLTKCNKCEQVFVTLGSAVGMWVLGRAFGKTFYRFCDDTFNTEIIKELDIE